MRLSVKDTVVQCIASRRRVDYARATRQRRGTREACLYYCTNPGINAQHLEGQGNVQQVDGTRIKWVWHTRS